MDDKHIIAVEIGSSKVKGAIGSVDASGTVTVKAVEEVPIINIVRHGQLGNVADAAAAMRTILLKIENRMSPRKVESVYVSVGGRSLASVERNVERTLPIDTEMTASIISQLKNEALGAGVSNRDVLSVEPREFRIDGTVAEKPIGMYGSKISMNSNLIVCRPQMKSNLPRLFEDKLGLRVNGYIVRQLAIADLVLNTDEKKLGCMLVDLGAETTTVSVYKNGTLQYLATIPLGSRNITRDIMQLNFVEEDAERMKREYGDASPDLSARPTDDVKFTEINNYVQHRAAEIVANIEAQRKYAGFSASELPVGIILVGKGSKLRGLNARLEEKTGMPIRFVSAISPSVRIANEGIDAKYDVDVIATLLSAARNNPQECLSAAPEPEPVITVDPLVEPDDTPQPKKGGWKFSDIFSKIIPTILDMDDPDRDPDDDGFDDEDA